MKKFILLTFLSIFTLSSVDPLYASNGSKSEAHHERPYTYDPNKHLTNDNP